MWDNRSSYVSNHDGDTITYLSDMGRRIFNQEDIRLLGVWAPELKDKGGIEVRNFVKDWHEMRKGNRRWPFLVTTVLVWPGTDKAEAKKTLDRYVATVLCIETNESLNLAVIEFVRKNGYGSGVV